MLENKMHFVGWGMPSTTMSSINVFGENVVEVVTFLDDDMVYEEEFEKSSHHVNHPLVKIYPKHVVEMINLNEVGDLDTPDMWGEFMLASYPIDIWVEITNGELLKTKK